MIRHELDELDSDGVTLSLDAGEMRKLSALRDYLRVEQRPDGRVCIRPSGHVGSARLSDSRLIAVTTKVPVANVLCLASIAYRSLPLPSGAGDTELASTGPVDWLAFLVVLEVEALLASGIRQGYVPTVDELPYVRGRIRFDGAQAMHTRPGHVACEFAAFLPDTPANRALRSALDVLRTQKLLPGLRLRLDTLLRGLDSVRLVPPSTSLVDAVTLTRITRQYEPALALCRLIFQHLGVEEGHGNLRANAFFFPMATVFEKAVANYLKRAMAADCVRDQVRAALPPEGSHRIQFAYRPDLVIGAVPKMVLDTKYKRAFRRGAWGNRTWHNHDAYQVVFYALALACPGVLLYVRDEEAGDVDTTFFVAGQEFTMLTVDLQSADLAGLDRIRQWVKAKLAACDTWSHPSVSP